MMKVNQTAQNIEWFTWAVAALACADHSHRSSCGRSLIKRAATASASDLSRSKAEASWSIVASASSAIALGIVAKRAASSQGSTFARANAESTLSWTPLQSSQIGA